MQLRLAILSLLLPITLATFSCMESHDLSRLDFYKRTLMQQNCQDETKTNMHPGPEKASKQDTNQENEYEPGNEKGTGMPQAGSEKLGKEMEVGYKSGIEKADDMPKNEAEKLGKEKESYKQDGYKPVYKMGTGMPQIGSDKLGKEMEHGYKPAEDMPKNGYGKHGKEKEDCGCDKPMIKTTTEFKTKTILEMKKPASSTKIILITEIHRATPVPPSMPMLGTGKLGLPFPMPSGAPPKKPSPITLKPSGKPLPILPKPSGVLPPPLIPAPKPSGAPIPIAMPKPIGVPNPVAPNPVIKPQPPSKGTAKLVGTSAPLVTAPANFKNAAAISETQNLTIFFGLILTILFLL
ncbi:hypothetical protein K3495_g3104 [Podosphaera aphanis]|nr:hypothetical protein K3495_g3104 [Podosphaera aphanis]